MFQDIRYGIRMMRNAPGFTAPRALTLVTPGIEFHFVAESCSVAPSCVTACAVPARVGCTFNRATGGTSAPLGCRARTTGRTSETGVPAQLPSENDRPPPAPAGSEVPDLASYDSRTGDSRDVWAEGGCEAGSMQECRVYLPAHDGIQPCFVGVQKCVDGEWALCDEAELVDANAGDSALTPSATP